LQTGLALQKIRCGFTVRVSSREEIPEAYVKDIVEVEVTMEREERIC
jgi:hypothetical protein